MAIYKTEYVAHLHTFFDTHRDVFIKNIFLSSFLFLSAINLIRLSRMYITLFQSRNKKNQNI